MGESNSIINLGDLGKPANTLIEKIADAIGGIAKPWQIKRVAEAEAQAEKIRASAGIQVTELHRRAARRFLMEEAKKQNNIETIISKALPAVDEQAKPEQVEDDWITNFFDKCRLISDDDMQKLWAKILAGEANTPGHFSKRTIGILSTMDKSDAMVFSNLCSFGLTLPEAHPIVLVYDLRHAIYQDHGINFFQLTHLESIGLLRFDNLSGFAFSGLNQKGCVHYFGQLLWLEFPDPSKCALQIGHVMLTQAGQQLATICSAQPREGFVDYLRQKWKSLGYKIEPDFGPPQF